MAAKLKRAPNQQKKAVSAKKVVGRVSDNGRAAWRVIGPNGKAKTLMVSQSSMRLIDEAIAIYGPALKRLADR